MHAPTMFATATARTRRRSNGTSGDSIRLSFKKKKSAISTIESAVSPIVCNDVQPASGASDIA
jgi:hypothetical protein